VRDFRGIQAISIMWNAGFHFMEFLVISWPMIVIGTDIVEAYFRGQAGHKGIKAARSQYNAWRATAESAHWRTAQDVKTAHPKASIRKGGRVVFNIKANDYRLVAVVQYEAGVLMVRFFGSHEDYDRINAETI
jgi:mRNA interferase HigB